MSTRGGRFRKIGLGLDSTLVKPSRELPSPDVTSAYVAHLEQRLGATGVSAKHAKLLLTMVKRSAKSRTTARRESAPSSTATSERRAGDKEFMSRLRQAFEANLRQP